MDLEIVRKHWGLIELVARHDYVPNGANGPVVELKNNFEGHVDLWCGNCVITMMKTIYNQYKEKV
jgi:hypothetical protein